MVYCYLVLQGHMQQKQTQQLHIQQNIMQQYRGGSLPNVNQMVNANSGLDLQVFKYIVYSINQYQVNVFIPNVLHHILSG